MPYGWWLRLSLGWHRYYRSYSFFLKLIWERKKCTKKRWTLVHYSCLQTTCTTPPLFSLQYVLLVISLVSLLRKVPDYPDSLTGFSLFNRVTGLKSWIIRRQKPIKRKCNRASAACLSKTCVRNAWCRPRVKPPRHFADICTDLWPLWATKNRRQRVTIGLCRHLPGPLS